MRNIVENNLMCMKPLSIILFHITNVLCFIKKKKKKEGGIRNVSINVDRVTLQLPKCA